VEGGDENGNAGVVPRACRLLMRRLAAAALEKQGAATAATAAPAVSMTAVEIYAERVRCLLGGGQNLPLKQDPAGGPGAVRAEGATEVPVRAGDAASLSAALRRALSQRATAATEMNSASSRSHCVVTLRLLSTGAKLQLVDLAGSERADRTGAQGAALAEGAAINRSLSALANVVSALAGGGGGMGEERGAGGAALPAAAAAAASEAAGAGKPAAAAAAALSAAASSAAAAAAPPAAPAPAAAAQHVPYRDSKLTRLLQDSLGGCARTVLVVCCSPAQRDAAETLSSLRFASRARGVKCSVGAVGAPGGSAAAAEAAAALALAAARAEATALRARLSRAEKGSSFLLPWVLRCASAAVLGAYVAWEGGRAEAW